VRERLTWSGLGIGAAACLLAFAFSGFWRIPRSQIAVSIAVLPFANMSGDPRQEFFSDGMTEEITAALTCPDSRSSRGRARIRVPVQRPEEGRPRGRSSARRCSYHRGFGAQVGSRVRITAQLVKANDGVNVWTNSYDRELTDIFAIQEEIAATIARALSVPLGLKPGSTSFRSDPPIRRLSTYIFGGASPFECAADRSWNYSNKRSPGTPTLRRAGQSSLKRTGKWHSISNEGVMSRDGRYWSRAQKRPQKRPLPSARITPAAMRRSRVLIPGVKAIELAKQGLVLDPEEPELLNNYSQTLRALGYLKESLRVREQLALVEPFNALYNRQTAEVMLANGKIDAGLKALEALHGAAIATATLSRTYAWQGRLTEAADALLQTPVYPNARPMFEAAARLLRSAADKTTPPMELPVFDSQLNFVYAYIGGPECMLDWPDKARRSGDYRPILSLWWSLLSSVRKTERFKRFARDAGMADYWHAHGWPDLCHPVEGDDFVCD
jgi:TolB-like protein